jgi:hypothetical protein
MEANDGDDVKDARRLYFEVAFDSSPGDVVWDDNAAGAAFDELIARDGVA